MSKLFLPNTSYTSMLTFAVFFHGFLIGDGLLAGTGFALWAISVILCRALTDTLFRTLRAHFTQIETATTDLQERYDALLRYTGWTNEKVKRYLATETACTDASPR